MAKKAKKLRGPSRAHWERRTAGMTYAEQRALLDRREAAILSKHRQRGLSGSPSEHAREYRAQLRIAQELTRAAREAPRSPETRCRFAMRGLVAAARMWAESAHSGAGQARRVRAAAYMERAEKAVVEQCQCARDPGPW